MELADARSQKGPDLVPAGRDKPPCEGEPDPYVELPERTPEPAREPELERRDSPAGPDDARQLAQCRRGLLDVAEEVREREPVERAVLERKLVRAALDEPDPFRQPSCFDLPVACGQHLGALVEADDPAACLPDELDRDGCRPRRHVEHFVAGPGLDPRDEEAAPAWVLAEREQTAPAVVRRPERREEPLRNPRPLREGHDAESMLAAVALRDDLDRAAAAAGRFAGTGEELEGVVPAEPERGERTYLCAFTAGEERSWLVLDDHGEPLTSRDAVRRTVSIVAMCELAEESAGGGELGELRERLVALRLTESPPGIEEAEDAALALEQAIGAPPRLAEPAYLDRVGAATRRLEEALGPSSGSPFAEAMKSGPGTVEELAHDVESNYKLPLD
jgi:hypothetical protein